LSEIKTVFDVINSEKELQENFKKQFKFFFVIVEIRRKNRQTVALHRSSTSQIFSSSITHTQAAAKFLFCTPCCHQHLLIKTSRETVRVKIKT
jgi:hypothetical protein